MRVAIEEAELARSEGEVPVGAVVVSGTGQLLSRRHNQREALSDPSAHAELLAISEAAKRIGSWRCIGCTVIVTLEPCPMCAAALVAARVQGLVFGASDPKAGACGSLYNLCSDPRLNWEIPISRGVLAQETSALLSGFFESRRNRLPGNLGPSRD